MRSRLLAWLGCLLIAMPLAIAPALSAADGGGGSAVVAPLAVAPQVVAPQVAAPLVAAPLVAVPWVVVPLVADRSGEAAAARKSLLASDPWFGTRTRGSVSPSGKVHWTTTASLTPVALWR